MARKKDARLERLRRAAGGGDAQAAVRLVQDLLSRRGRARLEEARRHAELALQHPDPLEATFAAGAFVWGDDCGGWDEPDRLGADPAFGLSLLRRLARRGNADAMYSLSLAFQRGSGVRKDFEEALRWARRAARAGDTEALNNLGVRLFYGEGVERDERRAARVYREASALGSPHAAGNLARSYRWGDGVRKDVGEAMRLHRLAARRGHATSKLILACAYLDGDGVRRDARRGTRMLRALVGEGLRDAMDELAARLVEGDGMPKDLTEGLKLARTLARAPGWKRRPGAMLTLGNHFHDLGESKPKHFATAMDWYRRAAADDDARAWRNMANCLFYGHPPVVRRDRARGLRCLRRAVELGDEDAMADLGELLLDGEGLPRNRKQGLALLERAVREHCRPAAGVLAARYRDGRGLPRDARKAREWARLAKRWEVEVPPAPA